MRLREGKQRILMGVVRII